MLMNLCRIPLDREWLKSPWGGHHEISSPFGSENFSALQLQVPCNALHMCITNLQVLGGSQCGAPV